MGDCDVRGRSMASLVGIVPPNQLPGDYNLNLLDDAEIHYSMENDPYSDLPIDEGNHAQVLSEVTHDALLVPPSANFQVSPMNYTKNGKCMPPPLTNSLVGSLGDLAFGSMSMSLSVSSALSSSEMSSPMISSSMPFSVSSDRSSRLIHLKEVVQEVRDSIWCRTDNLEPTDSKGRSIYLDFVMQDGGIYTCMFCQKKIDRQDRATGHIRKHFNHRPFRCDARKNSGASPISTLISTVQKENAKFGSGQKLFKSDLRQHRSHCSSGLVLLSRDDD
ncbi:hypothetical protein FRC17_002831 [Serendipita sp. 399]|nr:hypothetical protein FRC17_002831 [Serendipita sp. 399]